MIPQAARAATAPAVVTKAAVRAADRLALSNRLLAEVLGVSEATVSRMGAGTYQLAPASKPFELAVLFVRLYRSLDAIVGGDAAIAQAWLRNNNTVLGAAPLSLIASVSGLVNVVAYLDTRRAVV
jgi:hypothetical protein